MGSGAKTHVALVDRAANLTEALVMKSKYITQTTEVDEYNEEDHSSSYSKDQIRITDYEDGYLRVTNEQVRVTTQRIKIV